MVTASQVVVRCVLDFSECAKSLTVQQPVSQTGAHLIRNSRNIAIPLTDAEAQAVLRCNGTTVRKHCRSVSA